MSDLLPLCVQKRTCLVRHDGPNQRENTARFSRAAAAKAPDFLKSLSRKLGNSRQRRRTRSRSNPGTTEVSSEVRRVHRCLGGRDVPWSLVGALVSLGLTGFLGRAGALFIRRVGASAIWSLSGEYRTWRGHLETVAIDPSRTSVRFTPVQ
jgi:hypothetical protein